MCLRSIHPSRLAASRIEKLSFCNLTCCLIIAGVLERSLARVDQVYEIFAIRLAVSKDITVKAGVEIEVITVGEPGASVVSTATGTIRGT